MAEMAREEIASGEAELLKLEDELQRLLLPKDPDDARNAFLEIRAGTGGDESALFAGDLLRMYTRYAERTGWRCEIVSESESELGGFKEVVLRVVGDDVFGAAALRIRRPPRAARAGDRNPGPHPHQRLHRGRAGRAGRSAGGADQPGRPAHRHLPRQRRRRPAHQQDRLGGAHHAHPDRHRGRVPGRPQPAPQQGQGAAGAVGPHPGKGAQRARRQGRRHCARA